MDLFRRGDGLMKLIAINTLVFIIIQLFLVFSSFSGSNISSKIGDDLYLASTSNIHWLILRPWSIITHMFAHVGFRHFLFNMIFLYVAGNLFRTFADSKKLVSVYILGGLSGFLLYFIFYNLFPALNPNTYILGASASAMAIVIATATMRPQMPLNLFGVFRIRLVWLAVIFVLVDLWSLRRGENTGGHIGHLGGALLGYFYAKRLEEGKPMGTWIDHFFEKLRRIFQRKPRMAVKRSNPRLKTDEEFNEERLLRQKRVDEILDRIGRSGYDSLSKEEKEFLFKHSQK